VTTVTTLYLDVYVKSKVHSHWEPYILYLEGYLVPTGRALLALADSSILD
jgi:hypothetical protein